MEERKIWRRNKDKINEDKKEAKRGKSRRDERKWKREGITMRMEEEEEKGKVMSKVKERRKKE